MFFFCFVFFCRLQAVDFQKKKVWCHVFGVVKLTFLVLIKTLLSGILLFVSFSLYESVLYSRVSARGTFFVLWRLFLSSFLCLFISISLLILSRLASFLFVFSVYLSLSDYGLLLALVFGCCLLRLRFREQVLTMFYGIF